LLTIIEVDVSEIYTVKVLTPKMFKLSVVSMYPDIIAYKAQESVSVLSIVLFNPTLSDKSIECTDALVRVNISPILDTIKELDNEE
jgi:hypothetical protein